MSDRRKWEFEVIRVKNLYQASLQKVRGNTPFISIDTTTKRGQRNYKLIVKIIDEAAKRKVNVSEYITVMFEEWVCGRSSMQYPYLSYLTSDSGFNAYNQKYSYLNRRFRTDKGVKAVVDSHAPNRHEKCFVNCWYNGFPLLETAGILPLFEKSSVKLFTLFLAYSEVFTPEFMITHSRFSDLQTAKTLTFVGRRIRTAILDYTQSVQKRVDRNPVLLIELMKTRRSVQHKEKQTISDLGGLQGRRLRVWKLLV